MIPTPTYLENYKMVTDIYGCWPSFHDAEVRSILLDRNKTLFGVVSNARVELIVHCFEITQNVKNDGFFDLIKHHLVHFVFSDVRDLIITGFNHQNAIVGLLFDPQPEDAAGNIFLNVSIDPAHGVEGSFIAHKGKILSVIPCNKNGNIEQANSANLASLGG
jgi:hypothetical protein